MTRAVTPGIPVPRFIGVILAGLVCFAVTAHAAPDPTESVRATTRALLERLDKVQPLYKSNPEKFFSEVEDSLAPHIADSRINTHDHSHGGNVNVRAAELAGEQLGEAHMFGTPQMYRESVSNPGVYRTSI